LTFKTLKKITKSTLGDIHHASDSKFKRALLNGGLNNNENESKLSQSRFGAGTANATQNYTMMVQEGDDEVNENLLQIADIILTEQEK
jgi:hypothetical protein